MTTVAIRDMRESDTNYILKAWLESYRYSCMVKHIENDVYYDGQKKVIERALIRGRTIMAVNTDDDDHLFGFLCFEPTSIAHYVYVKRAFNRFGLAKMLFVRAGIDLTRPVVTSHWQPICDKVSTRVQYNPYILSE